MKITYSPIRQRVLAFLGTVAVATLAFQLQALPLQQGYSVTNLVSDVPGVAANTDPLLLNPWGFVFDTFGNLIVADNVNSQATFYGNDGTVVPFSINAGTAPTGFDYNLSTNDFKIGAVSNRASAQLLFCTEAGTITGFSLAIDFNTAEIAVDDSASGAVYKGLTLARIHGKQYLYATDFHNGKVKVYDNTFKFVGSFTDPRVDAGYAPFNIRNIGGFLFVTFAKQAAGKVDDAPGAGNGFVDIFTPDGILLRRLIAHGALNSPYGITFVPFTYGKFGGTLLVGNSGDGKINSFDVFTGRFNGTMSDTTGRAIVIPGLHSLKLQPHMDANGDDDCDNLLHPELYFTAGPNNQTDGLIGIIQPVQSHR